MSFSPYLNFNGNTKEVIYFYKEAFGTEEPDIMYFKDMPPDEKFQVTDANKDLVMHASLKIKDTLFMFSDTEPGKEAKIGDNVNLMYSSTDLTEVRNAYNKLKEGGTVIMELGETFWSSAYGYLVDKFGIVWQFNLDE